MARDKHNKIYLFASLVLYLSLAQILLEYNAYNYHLSKSEAANKRRTRQRIPWSNVMERISDAQFRRMFRMTHEVFSQLCAIIIESIGEKKFKSEYYINSVLHDKCQLYMAHCKTSGQ